MSPINTWTFLLLLCINFIVYSKKCIWHQDNHINFQHMIPETKTSIDCQTNINFTDTRPVYSTSQVESAAITVRTLFYKIIQFYTKHQEKLLSNQKAWELFQEDLYHQANLLEDCMSKTTEDHLPVQIISKYFSDLENIFKEQDDAVCAKRIIHVNIKRTLLQADRLSKRMFLISKSH